MRLTNLLVVGVCAGLTGCSALVKNAVDTQPRVAIEGAAFERPETIVHGDALAYEPSPGAAVSGEMDADLALHAPVIVQGFQPAVDSKPAYDYWSDGLGAPRLTSEGDEVYIDTALPEVYARVEHAVVEGVELKELVYAFWYPERPVGSIEKGRVDGGILRITLDRHDRPAVFEYSQPCGCFHGVFVSTDVEAAAAKEFRSIEPHRVHAVEPALGGADDWVVRDLVEVVPGGRIVLYMSAGKHFCEAIRYQTPEALASTLPAQRPYALRPYDALTHAPRDGGGEASIFNERGLVRGAKRWQEELVLADLENPGWPRHLDRMLIHWDSARWDDPTLLEHHLRLPHALTSDATDPVVPSKSAGVALGLIAEPPVPAPAAFDLHDRRLVLFTNRYCLGCQHTKKLINESAVIQRLMKGWAYEVVDTATPEGASLAAQWRVTAVPELVGIAEGAELFRSDDLDEEDKLINVISRQ